MEVISEIQLAKLIERADLLRVHSATRPEDVAPPSPAELEGDLLLFDAASSPPLEGARHRETTLPWVSWILAAAWSAFAVVVVIYIVEPRDLEDWVISLLLIGGPTLGLDLWLASVSRDRIRLRRHGQVLFGVAECVDAKVTGEGDEYFELTFGIKFQTPDGHVRSLFPAHSQLVDRRTLRGRSANRASPLPPGRCPVAVLWAPQVWRVL